MKRRTTPEGGLLRACLQRLAMEGPAWCGWRQNAGMAWRGHAPIRLAPAGCADIVGAWRGLPLAIECKTGKTNPEQLKAQAAFAEAWRTAGGSYLRIEDVGALDEWLRANRFDAHRPCACAKCDKALAKSRKIPVGPGGGAG